MQVKEAMTDQVAIASPKQTVQDAARMMARLDIGVLPVGENDRLVGMITDRDIAVRAVAAGKGPSTPIEEVMSREVRYCYEDDDIDDHGWPRQRGHRAYGHFTTGRVALAIERRRGRRSRRLRPVTRLEQTAVRVAPLLVPCGRGQ